MLAELSSRPPFILNGRGLDINSDIDGTICVAPPALDTFSRLVKGGLVLPPLDQPIEFINPNGHSFPILNWFLHRFRPFTADSEWGLERLRALQANMGDKKAIKLDIVTGRYPDLHKMTMARLEESGRKEYFTKFYLNDRVSSAGFKETVVEAEIEDGNNVVLIDDDLMPCLRVARLQALCQDGQAVFAYMINNIANHPRLLEWAGVKLPSNVLRVDSFDEAAIDIGRMVYAGVV